MFSPLDEQGFWRAETVQYDSSGQFLKHTTVDPTEPIYGAIPYGSPTIFLNYTLEGSRRVASTILMFPPSPEDFCNQTLPDGHINAFVGTCGVDGFAVSAETFATSSYERDGSVVFLPVSGDATVTAEDPVEFSSGQSRGYAVDERTIYTSVVSVRDDGDKTLSTSIFVFLDAELNKATLISDNYRLVEGEPGQLTRTTRYFMSRLSEEEYLEQIPETYEEFNVTDSARSTVPPEGECLSDPNCPAEEDWCSFDPECSVSPYQEPDAQLRAGVIAAICVLGAILIIIALLFYMQWKLAQQEKRYRANFAARVAETMDLRASVVMLTPEALAEEFERIDTGLHDGGDGYISREELWDFLSSGKAGEMNQKDFNALFEALDTDGNGKVDFLEFCSFLSMCGEEFRVAREDHFGDTKARRGSTNNSQQFQKIAKRISLASSKHLSVEDVKNPNSSSGEEAEETDRKASEGGDSEGAA
jgi:hypothetical protein